MANRHLTVAWLSYFPIEWLPQLPAELRGFPRGHPASWQRVLVEELKKLPDLKLHIFSIANHFKRTCQFEMDAVTFHCIKVPRATRASSLFWWESLLLRRHLRAVQPDLVHAWGSEHGAAMVASRLGYPYLVTMQGLLGWYCQHVQFGWRERLETRLERVSLRRASIVTTESAFAVKWLAGHYPHLEIHQVEHAPNWLFQKLPRRLQTGRLDFLFVGVPSFTKDTDLLLGALDRLHPQLDFRLTLILSHDDALLAKFKGSTSTALWERIKVRHSLTQPEVAEEMAQATMVLFPTRVDTSPNSIKEAVVAGVPVVASAVGGIVDYVLPGKNGITFPAGNLEAFIGAIQEAVAHPLLGRGKVDPNTLPKMREYLSPRVMGEKFSAAYQRVLDRAKQMG